MKCLSSFGTEERGTSQSDIDSIILEGVVIVQMLFPKTSRTIDEYFSTMFAPYILQMLQKAKRVDIIWDIYKDDSLKKSLRDKRGTGQRCKVTASARIPSDWKGFFREDRNKEELFKLLANKVCHNL